MKSANSQDMSDNQWLNKPSVTTTLGKGELEHELTQTTEFLFNPPLKYYFYHHLEILLFFWWSLIYQVPHQTLDYSNNRFGANLQACSRSYLKNMVRPAYVLHYVLALSLFLKVLQNLRPPYLCLNFKVAHTLS